MSTSHAVAGILAGGRPVPFDEEKFLDAFYKGKEVGFFWSTTPCPKCLTKRGTKRTSSEKNAPPEAAEWLYFGYNGYKIIIECDNANGHANGHDKDTEYDWSSGPYKNHLHELLARYLRDRKRRSRGGK